MLGMVQQWQAIIGSLIGFGGVIITLLTNSRNNRAAEDRRRREDAQSLRVALREELTGYRDALNILGKVLSAANVGGSARLPVPIPYRREVFAATVSKIGLLSASEIEAALRAYQSQLELGQRLSLFVDRYNETPLVEASHLEAVLSLMADAGISIERAVRTLGGSSLPGLHFGPEDEKTK